MTEATYTLQLTEAQAKVLCTACEVLARLGIGQFRDALAHLPLDQVLIRTADDVLEWHADLDLIGDRLSRHMIGNVNGWNSSLSIASPLVKDKARVAWDMYQVLRHRLNGDSGEAYSLSLYDYEHPPAKIERSEPK